MGIDGISIWQLLIILFLVVILFGTGKLRRVGTDMGHAIRGFKRGLNGKADDSDSGDTKTSASDMQASSKARNEKSPKSKSA